MDRVLYVRVPSRWRRVSAGLSRRLAHVANARGWRDWLAAWPFAAAVGVAFVCGALCGAVL